MRFILICLSLLWGITLAAQERNGTRVAFYNLENLFHPDDDSLKRDEEFTPDGTRYWSYYRYREKLNRMAKALLAIGDWEPPEIVGLAEVENRQVLEDLVASPVLRKFNYRVIHYESPDRRGIDVGAIYRADLFTVIQSRNIPVQMPDDPGFATRDLLYLKGLLRSGDTLHLIYCHWPSRYGGQQQSEPKRIQAALTVKKLTDSLFSKNPNQYIVVAGDFNDEWNNESLLKHLEARPFEGTPPSDGLYNLMATMNPNQGSHRYRGQWAYLDQVIVSGALLNGSHLHIEDSKAHLTEKGFLLETDEKYPGQKPFRTFIGMRYHGGFSDHLPVYVDLITLDN